MKIDKSRRIMFFVSLIGIIIVTLVMGTTFAYQTLVVDYKEGSDNDTIVEAGKLNVSYENNNKIDLKNMTLLPDYKTADYTEFTIRTNDTSYDVAYQINLTKLEYSNAMISENFKYTITLAENDEEFVIGEGDFSSLTGTEINLPFNMNSYRILEKNKNETLRLYLWLQENENSQSFEKGSFKGTIELVSLFSNEITDTIYKTFKIYGNSIQNGTPSVDNPIEIYNLGEYDELTGKYKIPISIKIDNIEQSSYNIMLDAPLRSVNNESDYIDIINGKVIRNIEVVDNSNTLLLENSYVKLEVPINENLGVYTIPYIEDGIISICSSNNVCASNIEIEMNK